VETNPTPNEPVDDPPIDDALRAAEIHYGLKVIHHFIDLSAQLAALIVEDAKAAAARRDTPAAEPPAEPSPKPTHAADLNLLFRGVRRAVLLTKDLLAPPKPEPQGRTQPAPAPGARPSPIFARHRDDTDHLDRLDTLDTEYLGPRPPATDAGKILEICRQYNIKAIHGTTPLLDRPLQEVKILSYKVGAAIASALLPFKLVDAGGIHPVLPDTS
jgi:hypothetical protein